MVEALAAIFVAAFGASAVVVDRGGDDFAMVAFMQGPGAALTHTPDIVILGLEAPNVYTCIEVKTFDPTGPTNVSTHHTDTTRLGAHIAVERASRRDEASLVRVPSLPSLPTSAWLSSPSVSLAPLALLATASSPSYPAVRMHMSPLLSCRL